MRLIGILIDFEEILFNFNSFNVFIIMYNGYNWMSKRRSILLGDHEC